MHPGHEPTQRRRQDRRLRAGQRVVSGSGRLYKVVGFTLDNLVVVVQVGFQDPAIRSLTFHARGLYNLPRAEVWRHKSGLVEFEVGA